MKLHVQYVVIIPGGEDCLYMLDIVEEELYQFSDKDVKRVSQIKVLADESLVLLLAGSHAHTVHVHCTMTYIIFTCISMHIMYCTFSIHYYSLWGKLIYDFFSFLLLPA